MIDPYVLRCAPWFILGTAVVLVIAAHNGHIKTVLGGALLASAVAAALALALSL